MTETPETRTEAIQSAGTPDHVVHRNTRLYRALAWVGIVAGIVFIVAVVFLSGFLTARASGGYGWHRGYQSDQMRAQMGGCPMMQMMQPGGMAPGGMPGMPMSPMPTTTPGR